MRDRGGGRWRERDGGGERVDGETSSFCVRPFSRAFRFVVK